MTLPADEAYLSKFWAVICFFYVFLFRAWAGIVSVPRTPGRVLLITVISCGTLFDEGYGMPSIMHQGACASVQV